MNTQAQRLIRILRPARRRWLGLAPAGPKARDLEEGEEAYAVTHIAGRGRELKFIPPRDLKAAAGGSMDTTLLALRTHRQPLSLSYAALRQDQDGHGWDLTIRGAYEVNDGRSFLERYGLDALLPEDGLLRTTMEAWLATMLRVTVQEAVRTGSGENLRNENALTAAWCARLDDCARTYGLSLTVQRTEWESADAARAQMEKRQMEDQRRQEEARERERAAERRKEKEEAKYMAEKASIEQSRVIGEKEREHQRQVLEQKHQKTLLDLRIEMERAEQARVRAALEHEIEMGKLRNDLAAVHSAQAMASESRERQRQTGDIRRDAQTALDRLVELPEPLLQRLAAADDRIRHQAADRLVSPEFRFTPAQLMALGFPVYQQALVESLTRKAVTGRQPPVRLVKRELSLRDIGAAKVQSLAIGRSLSFELISGRDGCMTVLNLGTSGKIYVHLPNALVGDRSSHVESDRTYRIPGPELFPWKYDYREEGPAGWEHIAGIVSDEPVVPAQALARSTVEAPIVLLQPDEIETLRARLEDMRPDSWSVGVLSFFVG